MFILKFLEQGFLANVKLETGQALSLTQRETYEVCAQAQVIGLVGCEVWYMLCLVHKHGVIFIDVLVGVLACWQCQHGEEMSDLRGEIKHKHRTDVVTSWILNTDLLGLLTGVVCTTDDCSCLKNFVTSEHDTTTDWNRPHFRMIDDHKR